MESAKTETDIPLHDHLQDSFENIGVLYPNQNVSPHVNLFSLNRIYKEEKWERSTQFSINLPGSNNQYGFHLKPYLYF